MKHACHIYLHLNEVCTDNHPKTTRNNRRSNLRNKGYSNAFKNCMSAAKLLLLFDPFNRAAVTHHVSRVVYVYAFTSLLCYGELNKEI